MSKFDDERFRLRPGAPKARSPRTIARVIGEAKKAGVRARRPASRSGRGHVAARMLEGSMHVRSRRVTIKARIVKLHAANVRSTLNHLGYLRRDGVSRDSGPSQAYGAISDRVDADAFDHRTRDDRHQFRFIVSAEDAPRLGDLHGYTRQLMARMEGDLGTRLDWIAVDHWDTDNPHTHILLRGKDERGDDLVIAGEYMAHGMRHRAAEIATQWLGPRTDLEIRQSLNREVDQDRWTSLDQRLKQMAREGVVELDPQARPSLGAEDRLHLSGRMQKLEKLGLASRRSPQSWALHADAEPVLRAMGERGDIIRTLQRAMRSAPRELAIFDAGNPEASVTGKIVGRGLADELNDRAYLIVDGLDGRVHYVPLKAGTDLAQFPLGGIVDARAPRSRDADRAITEMARDGFYRTDVHRAQLVREPPDGRDIDDVLTSHSRRLEALRRAGHVERLSEGVWRIPHDLAQRGRAHDARKLGTSVVELQSHLSVDQQRRAIGSTWLDRQLVGGEATLTDRGFGIELRAALRDRVAFLSEQGLATRRNGRLMLATRLLATLRDRELASVGAAIATEKGQAFRSLPDEGRVSGIYRRSVLLASGRFALLDDGMGFSLVPWRPVIESRLGKSISAIVRGHHVSWDLGRSRGLDIG